MEHRVPQNQLPWLWVGLCVILFVPRAYLACDDQGLVWSDEVFQTLEQGHRLAFGYGLVPWEFQAGARSWLLPGVVAGFMKLLAFVGLDHGVALAAGTKTLFAALSALAFYPALRMAHALGGIAAGLCLGVVALVFPSSLVYGSRALAEVASAPAIAWGLWLLWPWGIGKAEKSCANLSRSSLFALLLAGGLWGLATLLRYQNGILLPAVVILVAVRCRLRPALLVVAGATIVIALGGVLDWLTWGTPFRSIYIYVWFNVLLNGSSLWGVSGPGFYLQTMLDTNGPGFLVLVLGFFAGLVRTWPVALLGVLYLVAYSLVPHKELRFLFPLLPVLLLCAATGLVYLLSLFPLLALWPRTSALGLGAILLVLFAFKARHVTFRDIGQDMDPPEQGGPQEPYVWGAMAERNWLLDYAGRQPDLCGIVAPFMNAYWTGGYTYLHRPVPFLWSADRPELDAANYALTSPGPEYLDKRYQPIAHSGAFMLYRRDGRCLPPRRGSGDFGRMIPMGVPGL